MEFCLHIFSGFGALGTEGGNKETLFWSLDFVPFTIADGWRKRCSPKMIDSLREF